MNDGLGAVRDDTVGTVSSVEGVFACAAQLVRQT
jgi:hypothetical protein